MCIPRDFILQHARWWRWIFACAVLSLMVCLCVSWCGVNGVYSRKKEPISDFCLQSPQFHTFKYETSRKTRNTIFSDFYANMTFPLPVSESQVLCWPQIPACITAEAAPASVALTSLFIISKQASLKVELLVYWIYSSSTVCQIYQKPGLCGGCNIRVEFQCQHFFIQWNWKEIEAKIVSPCILNNNFNISYCFNCTTIIFLFVCSWL